MVLTQSEKQSLENASRFAGTKIWYLAYNPATTTGTPEADAIASGKIQYKKTTSANLNEVIYTSAAVTNYGPGNEFVLDNFFGVSQPLSGKFTQTSQQWTTSYHSGANTTAAFTVDGNGQLLISGADAVGFTTQALNWPVAYTAYIDMSIASFNAGENIDFYLNETGLTTGINVGLNPLSNAITFYGSVKNAGSTLASNAGVNLTSVTYPISFQLKVAVTPTSVNVSVGATTLFALSFASGSIVTTGGPSFELKSTSTTSSIRIDKIALY